MRLNDYFDRIFIINLERRPDRLKTITEKSKIYDFDFELFYAIDGKSISNDVSIDLSNIKIKPNELGCLLSHLSILKYCKENNIKNALILEDDADFAENFNDKFNNFVKSFDKEWNMIYFSGSIIETSDDYGSYSKLNKCYTTHSYAVNSNIYDYLIDILEKNKFLKPVDIIYSEIQESIKCWITKPFITFQSSSYSDIQEIFVDYHSIKKNL